MKCGQLEQLVRFEKLQLKLRPAKWTQARRPQQPRPGSPFAFHLKCICRCFVLAFTKALLPMVQCIMPAVTSSLIFVFDAPPGEDWVREPIITLLTSEGVVQLGGERVPARRAEAWQRRQSGQLGRLRTFREDSYMDPNQQLCLGATFDIHATNVSAQPLQPLWKSTPASTLTELAARVTQKVTDFL